MLAALRKLPVIRAVWPSRPTPSLLQHQVVSGEAVIVFVHGFCGNVSKTWGSFIDLLRRDSAAQSWDIMSLGFPSSLRIDVPGLWAADPGLDLLAKELRTTLSSPPFLKYRCIALVAHSMGGLISQRAILDDRGLRSRVTHLFLYGTPSGGLAKARLAGLLKRQLRDMGKDTPFVTSLRADWEKEFPASPNFFFRTIAGDKDEFVPSTSSLEPFGEQFHLVVPGHHLSMIQPSSPGDLSLQIFADGLSGRHLIQPAVDSALIAVEQGHFQAVVERFECHADELDEAALGDLALALDGIGRGGDALDLLTKRLGGAGLGATDAKGILAGRIKRRWLLHRADHDRQRARELYMLALQEAEAASDEEQSYYHAINVAFIDVVATPTASAIPASAKEMALRALDHCSRSPLNHWRRATEGEANLVIGDLAAALSSYEHAIALSQSPRELDSMYSHASRVAYRIFGKQGLAAIEKRFGMCL